MYDGQEHELCSRYCCRDQLAVAGERNCIVFAAEDQCWAGNERDTATHMMKPIHDGMPVILHSRDLDRWLNDNDESRLPLDLLRLFESDKMRMTPANRLVGNIRNNGPEMLNSA